jgi:hypothetical protein
MKLKPGTERLRDEEKRTPSELESSNVYVAPDLGLRLARYQQVQMAFHSAHLNSREIEMVEKLVDASRCLEEIFWRQSDPQARSLYESLVRDPAPERQMLGRCIWINASRFDLIDDHRPFVGTSVMPEGRGFYPVGLTRDEIEQYVRDRPESKAEIYSPYTVIHRDGQLLRGTPYHVEYRSFLAPAAESLRAAASLSSDKAFARFLRLRAEALLTDNYFESDMAWMELNDPKFDVVFAPYETYCDGLLGVKTSYGAAVLIRNPEESHRIAMFREYVPDIQDALPLSPEDRPSKRGLLTPMEVMDSPYRAGDLRHGYQAVAANLPNDPRIHEQRGSKKIFFKNFMDARVKYVLLPLAQKLMRADQAKQVSGEGYLLGVVMHEIAHGLGPAFARTKTGKDEIRHAIGPLYSALEEAKAQVVGMFGLKWLVDHRALPASELEGYYSSYVAGIFRALRFGAGEAHGQAEFAQFAYLSDRGVVKRETSGMYAIDYDRFPVALSDLAKELLAIEAEGAREKAEVMFRRYGAVPPELTAALRSASTVPVDIDPMFAFPDRNGP